MTMRLPIIGVCLLMCILNQVAGNGRLLEPRQRSSLWRDPQNYSSAPRNYDDHTINCGGLWKRQKYAGKCGVCGDAWDLPEPRPNEARGIYANGIIARTYSSDKRFIDTTVQILSSISGYFEFNICPNNNVKQIVTEQCLKQHPMKIYSADGTPHGLRYYTEVPAGEAGDITLYLEIPDGMVCSQCVLRWKWHGGNSYGECSKGWWTKGCGPQEQIINCADIAIIPDTNSKHKTTSNKSTEITASVEPETSLVVEPETTSTAKPESTSVKVEMTSVKVPETKSEAVLGCFKKTDLLTCLLKAAESPEIKLSDCLQQDYLQTCIQKASKTKLQTA